MMVALCMTQTASAQRWFVTEHQPAERVIGLLDLPDVTADYLNKGCEYLAKQESASAQLYSEPSKAASTTGAVYMRNHPEFGCALLVKRAGSLREEELPTQESGYELPAAVVYERRERWFRIAAAQGSAWIERANDKDFRPYPHLLTEKRAHLRNDWDGQLRKTAGVRSAIEPVPVEWQKEIRGEIEIEVLGVTRLGNDDWLHVRFAVDGCDDSLKALKPVEGWLPAYRSDGKPAAWFYSRGC
jgi:hypothetical protein